MFNSITRIQNTFGFFTTVAFTFGVFIALSDLFAIRTPSATIKPEEIKVMKGRPHYYSTKKEEYAGIRFSLDADLSSLFTWNTKEIFVYVTATWPSLSSENAPEPETNTAVIWDQIITAPSSDYLANIGPATRKKLLKATAGKSIDPSRGLLNLRNQKPKYQITHPSGRMAGAEGVTLALHYNVQPWMGILTWEQSRDIARWKAIGGARSDEFDLPLLKTKDS